MRHHEKKAFLKFFITYFVSVTVLILIAGFFYFSQMKNYLLKKEEFSLIDYARHIMIGKSLHKFNQQYHYLFVNINNRHIDIRNFTSINNEFTKLLPMEHEGSYLQVFKSKRNFEKNLWSLKQRILTIQAFLLLLFAYISYRLSKNALKPLEESIQTLDRFAKDLIHDLNTPVTSIKLNMKILDKIPEIKDHNAYARLGKSVHTISELHENLTILLQEETFQIELLNVCEIIKEVVEIQKSIYPNIKFILECSSFKTKLNSQAMKQILNNIISNACKYNSRNGYVKIYNKNKCLYIEDGGKGIKEPSKIFNRFYSAEQSSGLGLDIVKRLAQAMDIEITVKTNDTQGTIFILTMR